MSRKSFFKMTVQPQYIIILCKTVKKTSPPSLSFVRLASLCFPVSFKRSKNLFTIYDSYNYVTESRDGKLYSPIVILHMVEIRFHHRIILGPRWISVVVTLDKMQGNIDRLRAQLCNDLFKSSINSDHVLLTAQRRIVHIKSYIKSVDNSRAGSATEGR